MPVQRNPSLAQNAALEMLLARSLDERWHRYARLLRKTQRDFSERSVHDLRVAARRLIFTLDLISMLTADEHLRGMRLRLRMCLKICNPLRDVQVQLLCVKQLLPKYPVLEAFQTVLLLREQRLVKAIAKQVRRLPVVSMEKSVAAVRSDLGMLFKDTTVREAGRTAVMGGAANAFVKAVERRLLIDAKDTATIHRLRIAFKKLRYTLEALQPVLPGVTDEQLTAMNAYQQMMGDIQDVEILRANLKAYAGRRGRTGDASLRAVQRELLRRRAALVKKFLQSADTLFQFWNPDVVRRASLRSSHLIMHS